MEAPCVASACPGLVCFLLCEAELVWEPRKQRASNDRALWGLQETDAHQPANSSSKQILSTDGSQDLWG